MKVDKMRVEFPLRFHLFGREGGREGPDVSSPSGISIDSIVCIDAMDSAPSLDEGERKSGGLMNRSSPMRRYCYPSHGGFPTCLEYICALYTQPSYYRTHASLIGCILIIIASIHLGDLYSSPSSNSSLSNHGHCPC